MSRSDGSSSDRPARLTPSTASECELAELRERLTRVASATWPRVRVSGLRRLAGGMSSLTYLVEFDGAPEPRYVVKVGPAGLAPTGNRDMLRQARAIEALSYVPGVRVPTVLFTDAGDEHVGQLVAMSYCVGESCEPNIDDRSPTARPAEIAGRAGHAAWMLADMHAASTALVASEEAVPLQGEIARWDRALATLPEQFGLDWATTSAALRATVPTAVAPRLTHGDYRLGNLLCLGAEVTAVIDWEIWAAADPRTDLGWFLLSLDATLHPAAVRAAEGVPAPAALLAEYEAAGGTSIEDVDWFVALALYKFAATTGLIAKHALRRGDLTSWGARMITELPDSLRSAARLAAAR